MIRRFTKTNPTHSAKNGHESPLALLCCLLSSVFFLSVPLEAQPIEAQALEEMVYRYNNRFHYDSSKLAITAFLQRPALSTENRFYAYLNLSYTFKRLFDYNATLQYLDSALLAGQQTTTPDYFANNIACQKALAYFDQHQYSRADSLMQGLRQQNYRHLNEEAQSKIMMQEAYLLYLQKAYKEAENRYYTALEKMQASSPCDQPMIFVKLVELYSAMQSSDRMFAAYNKAMRSADSCGILKYNLYAAEVMTTTLEQKGQFMAAVHYGRIRDSLNSIYNNQTHRDKLVQLEAKHRQQLDQQQISLQHKALQTKNLLIMLLVVGLLGGCLSMMYLGLRQRQKRLQQDKENTQRFTLQLLQKTEDDRKRIAGHLHDSINHELLHLKNMLTGTTDEEARQRIDMLIEDVRHISHHLHPVVFSRVGLAHSIAQLAERVQAKNNFMLTADVEYRKVLAKDAELQLYRIIQEAVSNMVKHSQAVAGKITVQQLADSLLVEIKDNGKGFPVDEVLNSARAFGLHNILERSRAAGGTAVIRSDKSGTVITIKIPLQAS